MRNGNEKIGTCFTFAIVVRGELQQINELIYFLKASDLTIAHQEIGQEKMWIKKGEDNSEY
jgi:hypothetical protein